MKCKKRRYHHSHDERNSEARTRNSVEKFSFPWKYIICWNCWWNIYGCFEVLLLSHFNCSLSIWHPRPLRRSFSPLTALAIVLNTLFQTFKESDNLIARISNEFVATNFNTLISNINNHNNNNNNLEWIFFWLNFWPRWIFSLIKFIQRMSRN